MCIRDSGAYTYSTSGEINRAQDLEDNDHTVSAIAIAISERMSGEWMDYYEVVHKYLLDRVRAVMKAENYPDIHDMEW